MADRKSEDRTALIEWMLGAGTAREAEAAEEAAERWLERNPDDLRVVAAGERLAEKGSRLRDPERGAERRTLVAFAVVFLLAALIVATLTGSLYAALAAGFLVASPVTEFVWDVLYDRSRNDARRVGER